VEASSIISHTFTQPGAYSAMVIVRDSHGAESSRQITIDAFADDAPRFDASGVRNAASALPGISPGELVSLSGKNLGIMAGDHADAATPPLPFQIAGASVTVDGIRAPMLAALSSDGTEVLMFQVPFGVATPGTAAVVVSRNGTLSAPVEVTMLPANPAVFSVLGLGPVVLHRDGTLVTPSAPARPGEMLAIYGTGLGAVFPMPEPGAAAPFGPPAAVLVAPSVTIDGAEAEVRFAGLAPGLIGIYRIDLIVPDAGQPGPAVPLVISACGVRSKPVTIAVAH
jgi:uncharacterized protein (TIGR03437 family)